MEPFRHIDAVAARWHAEYRYRPRSSGAVLWRKRGDGWGNLCSTICASTTTERKVAVVLEPHGVRPARLLGRGSQLRRGLSRREHAVWSLYDYRLPLVIAPSFRRYSSTNSFRTLPAIVKLGSEVCEGLRKPARRNAGREYRGPIWRRSRREDRRVDGRNTLFAIDTFRKEC